ncbi:MAG: glycosyltransferase [Bdellovibrionota bacterium]|nr:MAG: glycosyltransferase [Bdellovibrionota bacterium]
MQFPELKFDLNRCGFDRFTFFCYGWCFSTEKPGVPLTVQLETLDDRVVWRGQTNTARPDVHAAFRGHYPTLHEHTGFDLRIPNFSAPRPLRVRVLFDDGRSFVIGGSDGGLVQAEPPRAFRCAENVFEDRYRNLLEYDGYPSAATKGNVCFLVSSDDLDSGRGDLYVAVGLGYRLAKAGFGVVFWPTEQWLRCPKDTDVIVAMLPTHVPFLERRASHSGGPLRVAWMRNGIDEWLQSPSLLRYDAYLCSSLPSLQRLQGVLSRPSGLLRLAAEHELFAPGPGLSSQAFDAISTINYWGNKREIFDILDSLDPSFDLAVFGKLYEDGPQRPLARFYRAALPYFELVKLYNSAKVCIDCYNEVTRPYGNVNSRVFESLSCGLPVLCNEPIEKDPILEGTQLFYKDAASLQSAVRNICEDPALRHRLGTAGRQAVVAHHSWAVRAEQFEEFLGDQRSYNEPIRTIFDLSKPLQQARPLQLAFYPPYLDNPYQHLLSFALEEYGISSAAVNHMQELEELDIFHLHWTAPISQAASSVEESRSRVRLVEETLARFVQRGGVLAWTLHNVLPHEAAFPEVEIEFRSWLARNASVIHLHTEETFELLKAHGIEIPREKAIVTPHGSYAGYYPAQVSSEEARARLGIAADKVVFLLFGQIRGYKGISSLVELAQQCQAAQVTFLVVGDPKGLTPELKAQLEALGEKVVLVPRRIDDWEVQYFYAAADYALLLSQTILNSGSAILALDFGVPLVAPARGSLKALVSSDRGLLYKELSALPTMINELAQAPSRFDRQQIRCWSAETLSWKRVIAPFAQALIDKAREGKSAPRTAPQAIDLASA